ncbi:MAG: hypothetical protein WBA67_15685 [Jannaschia sp.]
MEDEGRFFLPKEVRDGLDQARAKDRRATGGKLRVQVGNAWYPIRSCSDEGFEVALEFAPKLRGLVEIHDGPRLLRTVLIVAGQPSGDVMSYEFKRATNARSSAPLDYVQTRPQPTGYLPAF